MRRESEVGVVNVFTEQGGGGNPCPIVLDAMPMTAAQMQAVALRYGHESASLFPTKGYQAAHRLHGKTVAYACRAGARADWGAGVLAQW